MNIFDLTVFKAPFPKKRIGAKYDGGYIIVDVPNIKYELLLSAGIENDISFEEAFIDKYDGINCLAYDGTIDKLPSENPKIKFIKKNIGHLENENMTNLHDIIKTNDNIFIKMDIEGWEKPWLLTLDDEKLNKFNQIVMEFHDPYNIGEKDIFKKLNKNHYLVHFHCNNCCGTREYQGIKVPNIFECTFLHKKFFNEKPFLNDNIIPSELDAPNLYDKPDIVLDYPPFVNGSN